MKHSTRLVLSALLLGVATPAMAAPGDPVTVGDGVSIDPIIDGRLRWEHVDQDDIGLDADAVTMRVRAGAEIKVNNLALLAEGESTLAILDDYNAFPFPVTGSTQSRPGQHSVVADPENVELNRLHISYKIKGSGVTVGRQRINLDDQRWVGSVAWRQNEQTFDAVRGEAKIGPVTLDGTWSWSDRTVFGEDAGPRKSYDGNYYFVGAGVKAGPVNLKGFAYLLDFDDPLQIANSSQTYGIRATGALPIGDKIKIDAIGSYARQSDWKSSPRDFSADYINGEAGIAFAGLRFAGGYELLGEDNGNALQTPFATLHKFNGWADAFLTTPAAGLQDAYGTVSYKFNGIKAIKGGMNFMVAYHQFDSDAGDVEYGTEWDAQVAFKIGQVAILGKYANYSAVSFPATGDIEKFWLEASFAF